YNCQPIYRKGRQLGVIRLSTTLEDFQRQRRNSLYAVLVVLAITLLLCTLLSAWLAQGIAAPIAGMRNFAVRIGAGHFGEEVVPKRRDELGELAVALNQMSAQLASLDSERRAFLANVTHEFLTPVTNVQITLEALQSGADDEPELRERFVQ